MSNTIETINPATGKVIGSYNNMSIEQINQKTKDARNSFEDWKKLDISERCTYMRRLGRVMKKNKEDYAKLITEEMGKPIRQSLAEIEKCAWVCDYYSEHAESFLRDELIPTEFRKSLGLLLASCHGIFLFGK
jgi:acyl-CoA reductase-like NAD-dependent aldehyde dehydrogenase